MADSIHPNHAAAMVDKAYRLKTFVQDHCGLMANADIVSRLTEQDWEHIAKLAGERRTTLSPATRAQIVQLFRIAEREQPPNGCSAA